MSVRQTSKRQVYVWVCACICILVGICVCLGGSTVRGYSRFSVLCSLLFKLYTLLSNLGLLDSGKMDFKYIEIGGYLRFVLSCLLFGGGIVVYGIWYMVYGYIMVGIM